MGGAKDFAADLAEAKISSFDNVSNIRKGESDGEVTLTYQHELLESPICLQILATDVTSYPDFSSFMVFTVSEHHDPVIFKFLEHTVSATSGARLQEAIQWAAGGLTARISGHHNDGSEYNSVDDFSYIDDASEIFEPIQAVDEDSYGSAENDFALEGETGNGGGAKLDCTNLALLCKDLKRAEDAGLAVGLIVPENIGIPIAVSLSLRVSDLGAPLEALDAWNIKPWEFLVLLVRWRSKYPSFDEVLATNEPCAALQFVLGKCGSSKPSSASVLAAFDMAVAEDSNCEATNVADPSTGIVDFAPIHMSNTINDLLNQNFARLLRLRRESNLSWDEAHGIIFASERGNHRRREANIDERQAQTIAEDDCYPVCQSAPESLQLDYAMDEEEALSIPLVAMQLALRRFARCTKYCMVCHQSLTTELEALKPYVCSNSLCLFQYLSLGLGPSIENDILESPYVVDLLISFFYAALNSHSLREFPAGLSLQAPVISHTTREPSKLKVEICTSSMLMTCQSDDQGAFDSVKQGSWFVMVTNHDGSFWRRVCRIAARLQHDTSRVEIVTRNWCEGDIPTDAIKPDLDQPWKGDGEWNPAVIYPFVHDIDDLKDLERDEALRQLLLCAPSVLEMRSYLTAKPGRALSTWSILPRSTLGLIRWIVASNRSFIVQDGVVPTARYDPSEPQRPHHSYQPKTPPNGSLRVGQDWMQFRFAQGSPEKELEFMKNLRTAADPGLIPKAGTPSLFAWHGSHIGNWHSIIRTGLDFQKTLNGRAYGNGVYFSTDMSVSCSYSSFHHDVPLGEKPSLPSRWPKSELQVSCALSICEIVNRSTDFVTRLPYYVVDKLDWIQFRYILVKVNPSENAIALPSVQQIPDEPTAFVAQDSDNPIRDMNRQVLEIPLSAIPRCRREAAPKAGVAKQPVENRMLGRPDVTSMSRDLDLLEELLAKSGYHQGRKRSLSRTSRDFVPRLSPGKSPERVASPVVRKKRLSKFSDESANEFSPGSLDYSSLPQLPEPTWITSAPAALKCLNREVKELHSIQEREDIYTLGWYMDTSRVDNLFQWIVEFHTFPEELPLSQDMRSRGHSSIVVEIRFGSGFPLAPPFVRVVRPRFKPFSMGGGGHVTAGGAICSELLTNSGWSPALSMEKVLLQVRLGLCDMNPPARLMDTEAHIGYQRDYQIGEAIDAYRRAARGHGWKIPEDLDKIAQL